MAAEGRDRGAAFMDKLGQRAMPVLAVRDVAVSVAYYRDRLGFSVGGQWPDEAAPVFAILSLGDVTIALDHDPIAAGGRAHTKDQAHSSGWSAYVYIADADGYRDRLRQTGADVAREPEDAFYVCRDFDVRDPDGHLIAFGQDLNPGPRGPGL